MNGFVLTLFLISLVSGVGCLCYFLGKKVQKNENFENKEKTMLEVRRLRASLNDPDVVERLHERFKR